MSSATSSQFDLSLVIPAYNEAARISPGLHSLLRWAVARELSVELVLVDDGSTDGTADVVRGIIGDRLPLTVLRNEPNRGKGYSVRRGLLEGRGMIVAFSDADFSTPIAEADKMLAAINEQGFDIAIGSRAMKGSELAVHQPWYREYAGRIFSFYYRTLLLPGIIDSQCGFKFFRRDVANDILKYQTLDGWAFDSELLSVALKLGYTIAQMPVRWVNDPESKVKMLRDGPKMLVDIWRARWRHRGLRAQR